VIFRWHYFYFLVACLDFVMIFLYIFLFLGNPFVAVVVVTNRLYLQFIHGSCGLFF
jgi:hypothetical protein